MTATTSIATVCVHCRGREADPQTGRCLKCGKVAISPQIASEFSHPTLDRRADQARPSPSAAYRTNGHDEAPKAAPAAASSTDPSGGSAGSPPSPAEPVQPAAAAPEPQTGEAAPATPVNVTLAPPPTQADISSSIATGPAAPAAFKLPDSPATTKWIVETRALRDRLLAQAVKYEAQIEDLRSQAARNRESAQAFSRLLEQVTVGAESADASDSSPGQKSGAVVWGRTRDGTTFAACIVCGRSNLPHKANGRCNTCDTNWRNGRG